MNVAFDLHCILILIFQKQPTRVLKGSELQAQLSLLQEDVKKAKEKLVLVEKEKAHALEELKEDLADQHATEINN